MTDPNAAKLYTIIDELLTKHKSNDYVYGRLIHYIETVLPIALENATDLQKQREERRVQLSANRDEFTARFLQKNNYYYSSQTERFLYYDGLHFVTQNEDDIQHQILSAISSEKCLREWRYKVNKNIIKRIKERSPLNATPESSTIQFVINTLCPSIFTTRNHAKYFLTIIGECLGGFAPPASQAHTTASFTCSDGAVSSTVIAGTAIAGTAIAGTAIAGTAIADDTNLIIMDNILPLKIFPLALKDIMREIGNQCYSYFGLPNIFTSIKYKYYDHNYKSCRLLTIDRKMEHKKIPVPSILIKYMLDFLCVAAHYYSRYGSADRFLGQCTDSKLVEHALFLTKNTHESIVSTFIEKSLSPCQTGMIDMKNMIFIWKKFLNERAIPSIIFYDTLKVILKNKLNYDETKECFLGITSPQLPTVSLFMQFWEETIEETDGDDNCELGIDELHVLFKNWLSIGKYSGKASDIVVLELIQHFYSELSIVNNKTILHVKSNIVSGGSI